MPVFLPMLFAHIPAALAALPLSPLPFVLGDAPSYAMAGPAEVRLTKQAGHEVNTTVLAATLHRATDPWKTSHTDATRCADSAFHGCPSFADRNVTLTVAQHCLSRTPSEMTGEMRATCDGLRFASTSYPHGPFCGFVSNVSLTWLEQTRAAANNCSTVVFTVILGGYDTLRQPPTEKVMKVANRTEASTCFVAIVDDASLSQWGLQMPFSSKRSSKQGTTSYAEVASWRLVLLPISYPKSAGSRLSKTIRFSGTRMFPDAAVTFYVDGRIRFKMPVESIVRYFRHRTPLPWVAMLHPDKLRSAESEVPMALKRHGNSPVWDTYKSEIRRQQAFYESEGAYNQSPGMIDGALFMQYRVATTQRRFSGSPPPPQRVIIRWLDCIQMTEMFFFSERTQLSWVYLLNLLPLHRHVFFMSRSEVDRFFVSGKHGAFKK